ncbi:MAG: hypothetical protein LBQ22_05095 [Bacteroidales bacterium]|nr:hypothetical protein [Bacteroidales bacterium]
MKKTHIILSFLLIAMYSCNNQKSTQEIFSDILPGSNDGSLIITNKIMYDVPVVNEHIGDRSKNNPDWFWENLPTPEGDNFLKELLEGAKSGELKTYYYDMMGDYEIFDEIPKDSLKSFMNEYLTFRFEVLDTTSVSHKLRPVEIHLDHTNIKMLRFLEEWSMKDGQFCKKVVAVAPFFTIYHPEMEKTINSIYFWILVPSGEKQN